MAERDERERQAKEAKAKFELFVQHQREAENEWKKVKEEHEALKRQEEERVRAEEVRRREEEARKQEEARRKEKEKSKATAGEKLVNAKIFGVFMERFLCENGLI